METNESKWVPTIGLEIHAELKTSSKMFCGCKNDADEDRSNVNICPVCMAHPGTLPVINYEAVKKVLQVGAAVGGSFADFSEFDRKNYFYPDIPKDYQISQYKFPLISGGSLSGVELTRIHLEEDTARSSHEGDSSLVDFNRAGVPLMELVTEPVIHSADEVMRFGRELQLLLQYLGASDANMEKGEMRVEVNISLSKRSFEGDIINQTLSPILGTKTEIKNINSFRAAGRAVEYEIKRQTEILEKGEKVMQETRGFDENKNNTFSQRSKEDSHDYRYFPDPDIPKLVLSEIKEFSVEEVKKDLPETPAQKRSRYARDFAIKTEDIEVYVNDVVLANFFEQAIVSLSGQVEDEPKMLVQTLSNYVTSDIVGILKKTQEKAYDVLQRIDPIRLARLIRMAVKGEVSSRGAKDVLKILSEEGGDPEKIAENKGLLQKNDPEEIKRVVQSLIHEHVDKVTDYKNGKESILQFFIGQGMKVMKGSGNPEMIKKAFLEEVS